MSVRIEQAIARGETIEQICRHLDVTVDQVVKVRRRLDAIVLTADMTIRESNRCRPRRLPACGTPSGYNRHLRLREPIDDACRHAASAAAARRARRRLART